MRSEHDKAPVELAVFGEFVAKANLPIDPASIFKPGEQSQPDIFCAYTNGERVAFELFEICAQDIAKVISQLSDGGAAPIVTSDPTDQIVRSKLHKNYKTSIPIELLCYTSARTVSPDDQIVSVARDWAGSIEGPFRKVWLLGEKGVYEVWSASNTPLEPTAEKRGGSAARR